MRLIKNSIARCAERIDSKHAEMVIFKLELDSAEVKARIRGMEFTMEILKGIRGIKLDCHYSFHRIFDKLLFIGLYPLSTIICYFGNNIKSCFLFIIAERLPR